MQSIFNDRTIHIWRSSNGAVVTDIGDARDDERIIDQFHDDRIENALARVAHYFGAHFGAECPTECPHRVREGEPGDAHPALDEMRKHLDILENLPRPKTD